MKRITTLLVVLLALTSTSFAKVRYGIEGGAYINKGAAFHNIFVKLGVEF